MSGPDTIFALSSGSPPAGIALIRVSGPDAGSALTALTGKLLPEARTAKLATLRDAKGETLDRGLILWFPGPESATGEDVVELHLHGGRAVVAAVLLTLSCQKGLRHAEPGEFTRRAFENDRIDLAEAEGLADLLSAETEAQRRNAIAQVGGSLHRLTAQWIDKLVKLSAMVEAAIDFSDEDDVSATPSEHTVQEVAGIIADIDCSLASPPAERLKQGIRVAIIGPPNSGKSTLFNRLISRDAAIVSPIAGTTRDVIEAFVSLNGLPLIFIDTAGIREGITDPIETIGVSRSYAESESADIVLALGGWKGPHHNSIEVAAKSDLREELASGVSVSALTGQGIEQLVSAITASARLVLPPADQVGLNARHRQALYEAVSFLRSVTETRHDELLVAEQLRLARLAIGKVTGGGDTEAMLDSLFGTFCIGK